MIQGDTIDIPKVPKKNAASLPKPEQDRIPHPPQ